MSEPKSITFNDIVTANKGLKSTNIKGKEYIEVNQRIKAFRSLYPEGTINTEIISVDSGACLMKATVLNESGAVLGVGHAFELESSSYINKTSYIENCETSAVGRALGMCGIGIDTSIASYEEVANAIHQQETAKPETKTASKTATKAASKTTAKATKATSYICERCGNEIQDNGKNTARQIATASKKLFGKTMCFNCAHLTKLENQAREAEEADAAALPFPID